MRSQIEKAYDKYAAQYAEYLEERLPQYLLTKFISLLPAKAKVLDAGCAAGRDSIYLTEERIDVTGIDISREIIKIAEKKTKDKKLKIGFRKEDFAKLSDNDKTFDAIWCMDTLNHVSISGITDVLKEFKRILKDKGILFISAVAGEEEGNIKLEYMDEEVYFSEHSQVKLEEKLKEAGFDIIESSSEQLDIEIHINIFARKR